MASTTSGASQGHLLFHHFLFAGNRDAMSSYNYFTLVLWLIPAVLAHAVIRTFLRTRASSSKAPPSPPALPVIGHLHLLGHVLPVSLQGLAHRYGPLMQLRLGTSTCVVVSSTAVAREIFKTQELNFSSRPEFGSSEYFMYRGSRFVMAQYGDYWRFMKKLCMTRLLAVPQLGKRITDKFIDVREEEVVRMVESVSRAAGKSEPTDLSSEFTTLTNNMICRMAMSTRCSGTSGDAEEIKHLVRSCLELAGKLSVGDVLGPFKFLDFSGNGKKLVATLLKYDRIVERIMKEHETNGPEARRRKEDVLDILLETHRDPTAEVKLTRKDIKSFLLDIFMAGTDTSSAAMQWAMGELINRPDCYQRLRDEIISVVGPTRLVKESDVPNLPYLRAVIRETLRLHPSAPLIIRECGEDCSVADGSVVKGGSRVLVNVYAIMRDTELWSDPDMFDPDRFMEGSEQRIGEHQMEYKGQNFRFLPYGSGRRGCPGASLAMLMMHAAVGSLVQCFDWKVVDGDGSGKIDLRQGSGFAAEMAKPLICYPIAHINLLSSGYED